MLLLLYPEVKRLIEITIMGGAMGIGGLGCGQLRGCEGSKGVYCGGRVLGSTWLLSVVGVVMIWCYSARAGGKAWQYVSLSATCHQQRTRVDVGDTVHQLAAYMLLCCWGVECLCHHAHTVLGSLTRHHM